MLRMVSHKVVAWAFVALALAFAFVALALALPFALAFAWVGHMGRRLVHRELHKAVGKDCHKAVGKAVGKVVGKGFHMMEIRRLVCCKRVFEVAYEELYVFDK